MERTCQSVWNNCLQVIRDNVNEQSFRTWFEPIVPVKLDGSVLTIQVPSLFFFEWLEQHYVQLLRKTLSKELGNTAQLEYSIVMDSGKKDDDSYLMKLPSSPGVRKEAQTAEIGVNLRTSIQNPFVVPGLQKVSLDPQLSPNYTFDNFVEGDGNRLARSASYAVASKPGGTSFNPLMIYGDVSLGKTHLLQAIGNHVRETQPEKTVLYVMAEKFTNQFIESLKNNSVNEFVNFYQSLDILLIDDVQFFSGKGKTQDTFFHIFNHLHQSGKQLVLTSDKAPKDLAGVEERLLSRFKWGLSAELLPPDSDTRHQILKMKMQQDGIELPEDVVEYLASRTDTLLRESMGALISLMAHSSLNRRQVDLAMAKQMLQSLVKEEQKEVTVEYIQKIVSEFFELPVEMIKGQSRKREIVQARQISMFLAKNYTKSSLKSIGSHFGGRDHSTVIYACQTVNDLMETDKKFRSYVQDIQKKIKVN